MGIRQRTAQLPRPQQQTDQAKPNGWLIHWDQLEDWQRDNQYIHTGYVQSQKSLRAVIHSLGYLHNETGNIYTHFVPALVVTVGLLVAYELMIPIDHNIASVGDHAAFLLFGVSLVICLGMSAAFHMLKSHSERVYRFGNKLDYLGICVLIAGSMISLGYFAFDDFPRIRLFFTCVTLLLGAACGVVSLFSKFRTAEWRPYRAATFVLYGLSGVAPVCVSMTQVGFTETWLRFSLGWLLLEAFFYILGAFTYGILFPEKWAPGTFDCFGHSHQIFHVMVVVAAYCHFRALLGAYYSSLSRHIIL